MSLAVEYMKYDLNSEFDMDKHKQTFIHYLEVIIDSDGIVHYAVPSHQEYLIGECLRKYGWTRQELSDACPPEYYGDFVVWLCKMCGCISVWENYLQFFEINEKQIETLSKLKDFGLYAGNIPSHPTNIDSYRREQLKDTGYAIW